MPMYVGFCLRSDRYKCTFQPRLEMTTRETIYWTWQFILISVIIAFDFIRINFPSQKLQRLRNRSFLSLNAVFWFCVDILCSPITIMHRFVRKPAATSQCYRIVMETLVVDKMASFYEWNFRFYHGTFPRRINDSISWAGLSSRIHS